MLWALCFMKVYPVEVALPALCGGADPKTMRKHIWPMIFALAELEVFLVRQDDLASMFGLLLWMLNSCFVCLFRLSGLKDWMETREMIAPLQLMAQTVESLNVASFGTVTNSKSLVSTARLCFAC